MHVVGLSVLSGSHMDLVPEVLGACARPAWRRAGHRRRHHPGERRRRLRERGVAAVFTPKDFGLTEIMGAVVDEIRRSRGLG